MFLYVFINSGIERCIVKRSRSTCIGGSLKMGYFEFTKKNLPYGCLQRYRVTKLLAKNINLRTLKCCPHETDNGKS